MAFQDPYVTLQRLSDSAELTVLGNAEFTVDPVGNLTVTWEDPLRSRQTPARLTRADFNGFVSSNVEQQRNRAGAHLVVTDPGGALLKVTWREADPWTGGLLPPQELWGVATLVAINAAVDRDALSMLAYRADYRYGRGAGRLEARP